MPELLYGQAQVGGGEVEQPGEHRRIPIYALATGAFGSASLTMLRLVPRVRHSAMASL